MRGPFNAKCFIALAPRYEKAKKGQQPTWQWKQERRKRRKEHFFENAYLYKTQKADIDEKPFLHLPQIDKTRLKPFSWRVVRTVTFYRLFMSAIWVCYILTFAYFCKKMIFGRQNFTWLPVWQHWAVYWTLGNFLKALATINLPKSPTFLGNFCKGVKI